MTEPFWRDSDGQLTGRVAEDGVDLLHSETAEFVALHARLLTQENEDSNETILLQMMREEAWALAQTILSIAEAQQWGFSKPPIARGPAKKDDMN